jgi:hypothetical protein
VYIVLLAFFGPAAEQYYKAFAVTTKIDSIAGAEVDAVFLNAAATLFALEKLPCAIRVIAITTFAAAGSFRALNHLAYGELPSVSRYSSTSITANGNT